MPLLGHRKDVNLQLICRCQETSHSQSSLKTVYFSDNYESLKIVLFMIISFASYLQFFLRIFSRYHRDDDVAAQQDTMNTRK